MQHRAVNDVEHKTVSEQHGALREDDHLPFPVPSRHLLFLKNGVT